MIKLMMIKIFILHNKIQVKCKKRAVIINNRLSKMNNKFQNKILLKKN